MIAGCSSESSYRSVEYLLVNIVFTIGMFRKRFGFVPQRVRPKIVYAN